MKTQSDHQLARHYLAHRKGYSLGYVFRQSRIRYAVLGSLLLVSALLFLLTDDYIIKGFCLWAIGVWFGAIVRDFGWLRNIKQQWSFTERVIDWNKIEELAKPNKQT